MSYGLSFSTAFHPFPSVWLDGNHCDGCAACLVKLAGCTTSWIISPAIPIKKMSMKISYLLWRIIFHLSRTNVSRVKKQKRRAAGQTRVWQKSTNVVLTCRNCSYWKRLLESRKSLKNIMRKMLYVEGWWSWLINFSAWLMSIFSSLRLIENV